MTRRTVLGNLGGGRFGLRCSLLGFDALTDVDADMSFDSDWTDIVFPLSIGVISWVAGSVDSGSGIFQNGYSVPIPNQGYIPFVEARRLDSGTTVYDDFFNSTYSFGSFFTVFADKMSKVDGTNQGYQVLYLVHKIGCPSG